MLKTLVSTAAIAALLATPAAAGTRGGASGSAPTPRVALLAPDAPAIAGAEPLLAADAGRAPNYLRAFALAPDAARPFAALLRAVVYGDTLEPEVKLAMGYAVARQHRNAYLMGHLGRALKASARGRGLLASLAAAGPPAAAGADGVALAYAEALTRDVHGITDDGFRAARAHFNDSQIVELTTTVCFFNYFSRMTEALGLPLEDWAAAAPAGEAATLRPAPEKGVPVPRVGLISDGEIAGMGLVVDGAKTQAAGGLGIGIANSQRAMMRAPDAARAWRAYGAAARAYDTTGRELKLQVSFAVSNANGCRYCVVHQVVGLRRLGVDPNKLVAMMKDDSALTPRELAAVTYARKLTRDPASVTDADWGALVKEFGEAGAMEVLMQTCTFAFMNRFTDNLGLPSEDEAIKVYREVYGGNSR